MIQILIGLTIQLTIETTTPSALSVAKPIMIILEIAMLLSNCIKLIWNDKVKAAMPIPSINKPTLIFSDQDLWLQIACATIGSLRSIGQAKDQKAE